MRDLAGKNKQHSEVLRTKGIQTLELDVTDEQSISEAVNFVKAKAGNVDVLINNAGVASAGVTEAFSSDQLAALFDVNVFGVHRVTSAVLPSMRKQQSGLIINVGSILGRVTFPFFGLYGASKYAIEAMTDSLRYEVSQFGIDVALVQPSAYPTQMYGSALQPSDANCVKSYGDVGEIPGAMFGQFMEIFEAENAPNPHDVAETVLELIDTPAGHRSQRSVVGASFGADSVNSSVAPIQSAAVKALGLDHLETLKTP